MKIDPIPTICLTALTLMTGAVMSHWMGIDESIDLAQLRAGQSLASPTMAQDQESITARSFIPGQALARYQTPPRAATDPEITPDHIGQRFLHALEGFEQLQRENRNLRDQVAETNRDLMELQFRVDTHSESFRPLRATQPTPNQVTPGVLPPLEIP